MLRVVMYDLGCLNIALMVCCFALLIAWREGEEGKEKVLDWPYSSGNVGKEPLGNIKPSRAI